MIPKHTTSGFTLVELVISLAISMIVLAAIYSTYTLQRKTVTAQDQVTEMQQNLRAGLMMIEREVKLAGYNPKLTANAATCNVEGKGSSVVPGVHTANATSFGFSMDLDQDGNCAGAGENITYSLFTSDGMTKLGRKNPDVNQEIAEHFERIEFFYTLEDETQTTAPPAARFNDIRVVTISLLFRAARPSPNFVNNTVYTPASGTNSGEAGQKWEFNGNVFGAAPGDNIRRRYTTMSIKLRNMGS